MLLLLHAHCRRHPPPFEALLLLLSLIGSIVLACLPTGAHAQGRVAPLIPEEYVCNIVQNKWNFNGFVVNNTYSMTYYSSHAQKMIRADGTLWGMETNNQSDPSPITAHMQLSLLDFRSGAGVNTFLEISDLGATPNCSITPSSGYFAPPGATFLRDIGAIFAGAEEIPYFGRCQKWSFFLDSSTLITTYFTDDDNANYVRWDLVSTGLQTGVVTYLYNMKVMDSIPAHIFSGSQQCPKHSEQLWGDAQTPEEDTFVPFGATSLW